MTDQAKALREMVRAAEQQNIQRSVGGPRVITVASGKGGVGKTNLSVNLGASLVADGRRVALIDADIGLANVDIALGVAPTYTLRDVLLQKCSLSEAIIFGPGGLHVVAGGSGVHEVSEMDPKLLSRFVSVLEAMDNVYDFILIDTGAGVGAHVLSFIHASRETLLVVTPEPSSIADAYAVLKAAASQRKDIRWLIAINMARSVREGEQTYERLATACRRFLGVSPDYAGTVLHDDAVAKAVRMQSPFVNEFPRSAAARAVNDMARRLADGSTAAPRGVGEFMRRLLGLRG